MSKQQITAFVNSVINQDYSKANNQLRSIIENKLLKRINNVKNTNLFKNHE